MDLFKVLGTCLKGARASDEDISQLSSWMLAKWLSGDPRTVHIANVINQLYNSMPITAQYDMVRTLLHGKIGFIRFPKTPKQPVPELTDAIVAKYKCNPKLVPELLSLMSEEEVESFRRNLQDSKV